MSVANHLLHWRHDVTQRAVRDRSDMMCLLPERLERRSRFWVEHLLGIWRHGCQTNANRAQASDDRLTLQLGTSLREKRWSGVKYSLKRAFAQSGIDGSLLRLYGSNGAFGR